MDHIEQHYAAMDKPSFSERIHVDLYWTCRRMVARWKDDHYADEYVVGIIKGAIGLLNMDTGRLDCGTLDREYRLMMKQCGANDQGEFPK